MGWTLSQLPKALQNRIKEAEAAQAPKPAPAPRSAPAPAPQVEARDGVCRFTIPGAPMGKPRQTRADKWKKRPVVLRYREWADSARAAAPASLPAEPLSLELVVYLPIPESWSAKKKAQMAGQLHRQKPDCDNIAKSCMDALWKEDSCVASLVVEKRWDDGGGPRMEVEVA